MVAMDHVTKSVNTKWQHSAKEHRARFVVQWHVFIFHGSSRKLNYPAVWNKLFGCTSCCILKPSQHQTRQSALRGTESIPNTSSSCMRVMNCNRSAMKQRLHPQSVAEISRHSVLSEEIIYGSGTLTSVLEVNRIIWGEVTAEKLFRNFCVLYVDQNISGRYKY